jgi:hypothetical protein
MKDLSIQNFRACMHILKLSQVGQAIIGKNLRRQTISSSDRVELLFAENTYIQRYSKKIACTTMMIRRRRKIY